MARTFWKADASLHEYALPWPVFARKLWRFLGLELPHDPDDPLPAEEPATQPGQDKWYTCLQTRTRDGHPHTQHTHTTGPRPTNEQQRQRRLPAEDPSKAEWARRPCTIRRLLPRWRS